MWRLEAVHVWAGLGLESGGQNGMQSGMLTTHVLKYVICRSN